MLETFHFIDINLFTQHRHGHTKYFLHQFFFVFFNDYLFIYFFSCSIFQSHKSKQFTIMANHEDVCLLGQEKKTQTQNSSYWKKKLWKKILFVQYIDCIQQHFQQYRDENFRQIDRMRQKKNKFKFFDSIPLSVFDYFLFFFLACFMIIIIIIRINSKTMGAIFQQQQNKSNFNFNNE